MFPLLTPRNTDWNRRFQFTNDDAICFLIEIKNGLAYFAHLPKEADAIFYKCEATVFEKQFDTLQETVEYEFDPYENIAWKRYPGGL